MYQSALVIFLLWKNLENRLLFKSVFMSFYGIYLIGRRESLVVKGGQREWGMTCSKGPQAGIEPHGVAALPGGIIISTFKLSCNYISSTRCKGQWHLSLTIQHTDVALSENGRGKKNTKKCSNTLLKMKLTMFIASIGVQLVQARRETRAASSPSHSKTVYKCPASFGLYVIAPHVMFASNWRPYTQQKKLS